MQISEIVTASRTLLTPITPCSGLHHLVFLFPALHFPPTTFNSYWLSTRRHFSSLESSTVSIARLCHCWSQLPSFSSITNCLQHVQIGVPAASTDPISSRRDAMPTHVSFSHTPSGSQWPRSHYLSQKLRRSLRRKEEERSIICDEKLRATNYDFRRKSVTLRHRLSLPEKPLNDSRDLLVIKRQVCPLPLPTTIKHTTCK